MMERKKKRRRRENLFSQQLTSSTSTGFLLLAWRGTAKRGFGRRGRGRRRGAANGDGVVATLRHLGGGDREEFLDGLVDVGAAEGADKEDRCRKGVLQGGNVIILDDVIIEIRFVAHDDHRNLFCKVSEVCLPFLEVVEGKLIAHVKHEDRTVAAPVIRRRDVSEAFLSGRVPLFEFDELSMLISFDLIERIERNEKSRCDVM